MRSLSHLAVRWLLLVAFGCSESTTNGSGPAKGHSRDPMLEDGSSATLAAVEPRSGMRAPFLTEGFVADGPASPHPRPTFVSFHPRGAWRLAHPAELNNVTIWADHIVIRHDDARNEVSFSYGYWYSVPPPSGRKRDQALALAHQVAAEAAADPGLFPALARRYSEDLTTRDEGGELGGRGAADLSSWPHVLDALAAIRPGQTSNVVETRFGFHVFRRRQPPPEATLSGAHIVIGHDQAEWLKVQARGPLPSRRREEALALATELQRRASAAPERFGELVELYSEHRDAVLGGDFGSWSTREANPFAPRMRRLEQLAVGGVGLPIETHLGFEVILRTEARPRQQYAVRAALLPFDPAAPDDAADSKGRAFVQAEAFARRYAAEPQRFGAANEAPTVLIQWQGGRGVPSIEQQLPALELGAISPTPVQKEFSFVIFQRVAPEPVATAKYATELPAPEHPDLHFHLAQLAPDALRQLLRECDQHLPQQISRAPSDARTALRQLHETASLGDPNDSAAATHAVRQVLDQTAAVLGSEGYATYLAILRRETATLLLGAPADSLEERGF